MAQRVEGAHDPVGRYLLQRFDMGWAIAPHTLERADPSEVGIEEGGVERALVLRCHASIQTT